MMNLPIDLPSIDEMRKHSALEPRTFTAPRFGTNGDETFEYERILRNQIITPDGTLLVSESVHDYRTYQDANGQTYMVDGGNDYLRRNVCEEPYEELSIYVSEDHSVNRQYFTWMSFGVDGKGPSKIQAMKDMDTDHIHAILDNGYGATMSRELFREELVYRAYWIKEALSDASP